MVQWMGAGASALRMPLIIKTAHDLLGIHLSSFQAESWGFVTPATPHRFCRPSFCWHRGVPDPGEILPCRGVPTHLRCHWDVPWGAAELLLQVSDKTLRDPLPHWITPLFLGIISKTSGQPLVGKSRGRRSMCEILMLFREKIHWNGSYVWEKGFRMVKIAKNSVFFHFVLNFYGKRKEVFPMND